MNRLVYIRFSPKPNQTKPNQTEKPIDSFELIKNILNLKYKNLKSKINFQS